MPADMPPSGGPDGTHPSPRVAARRSATSDDPPTQTGRWCLHGPGGDAHLLVRPRLAGVRGELVVERGPHRVDRLVEQGVPPGVVDAERR